MNNVTASFLDQIIVLIKRKEHKMIRDWDITFTRDVPYRPGVTKIRVYSIQSLKDKPSYITTSYDPQESI